MDDPAGLAISEKLKAHTRSIQQAIRNANDGMGLIQVADSALREIGNILQRMRELAEEAANETLGSSERSALQAEYAALKSEIDRISDVTEYNGQKLIDGTISSSGLTFQIGFRATTNDQITLTISNADAASLKLSETTGSSIDTAANATSALVQIDSAITLISTWRGDLGAKQSRLSAAIANLTAAQENYSSAISNITDADFAYETAVFTRNQILTQAAVSVLAQANTLPQQALVLLR